jgi:splicing factor 3A subunit 1
MDTIKLTAQFVARNGQKFLQGLTERENSNHSFDFLKPTHGLFGYFTTLVE